MTEEESTSKIKDKELKELIDKIDEIKKIFRGSRRFYLNVEESRRYERERFRLMLTLQEKRREQIKQFVEFMDTHPGKYKQEEIAEAMGLRNYDIWVIVMMRLPYEPYDNKKIKEYQGRIIWEKKNYIIAEEVII